MKIYSLPTYNITAKVPFTATNPSSQRNNSPSSKRNQEELPNWARKAMLFTLLFFAFKNSPTVQNLVNPYKPTQEELDKTEFYNDTRTMIKGRGQVSSAFYHLNWLSDMEAPNVKVLGEHSYELEFKLDKQNFHMQMNIDKNNKDTIQGRVKVDNKPYVDYKAVFSPDNKDEFKILIKDKNAKYIFGRNAFGELYQVRNGKKVMLNKKNVERYREYQEMMDELDKFSFITDNNNLWRKLNYLLLIFLVYLEMMHDRARAKEKQQQQEDKNKEV